MSTNIILTVRLKGRPQFIRAVVARWLVDGFIPSAFGVVAVEDIKVEEAT